MSYRTSIFHKQYGPEVNLYHFYNVQISNFCGFVGGIETIEQYTYQTSELSLGRAKYQFQYDKIEKYFVTQLYEEHSVIFPDNNEIEKIILEAKAEYLVKQSAKAGINISKDAAIEILKWGDDFE